MGWFIVHWQSSWSGRKGSFCSDWPAAITEDRLGFHARASRLVSLSCLLPVTGLVLFTPIVLVCSQVSEALDLVPLAVDSPDSVWR